MPFQDFRFLTDAFARLGIKPPAGFNPGQMSTSAAGTLSDIVSDPSGRASLDRARAQGVLNIDAARQRGVGPANPIKGFNVSGTNTLGRGVTAPTIGTGTPRPPVIGPTITGPAPNTFGAPYIRDPALAREFVKGGLPKNVPPALTAPRALSRLGGLSGIAGGLSSLVTNNLSAVQQRNQLRQQNPGFLGQAQANLYGLAQTLTGGPFSPLPQAVETAQQVYGLKPKPQPTEYYGPAYASAEALGLPTGKGGLGKDYKTEELNAGLAAEQFRAGAGFPGQTFPPAPVITAPPVPGQQAGNAGAMETYMQLKQQAKTPEDYKRLDQLGMAIHQEKFGTPEMRMEKTIGTFNPLMAQMGLQQPTRPIIPDKEALVDRMDQQALEAQEFLRKLTKFNKKDEK